MSEASERLTGSTWDVEHLLSDALRPIEPPERLSGRLRGHALGGDPGGGRGALRLGRGAFRERAACASRSAQLGAPGGRRRRRRRRRRGPGRARAASPRPPAGQGRPAFAGRAGQAVAGRRFLAARGVARAAAMPSAPSAGAGGCRAVSTGRKPRIDSPLAEREAPEGEGDVEEAEPRASSGARHSRRRAGRARR